MIRPRRDARFDPDLTGDVGQAGAAAERGPEARDEAPSGGPRARPGERAGRASPPGARRAGRVGYRDAMRSVIVGESKAYGFTLVVWGTGALTIAERGLPGRAGTVAFLGGLLAGVLVAAVVAFGDLGAVWPRRRAGLRQYAGGLIHIASVGSAVTLGWLSALLVPPVWLAYLVAGAVASTTYQFVLAVEVASTVAGDGAAPPPTRGE
jgi:hypothetical protein